MKRLIGSRRLARMTMSATGLARIADRVGPVVLRITHPVARRIMCPSVLRILRPVVLGTMLALTCTGTIVHASSAPTGWWAAGHLFGGGVRTDPKLQRFDWTGGVRPTFGAEFAVGWNRMGFGLRVLSAQDEQQTENPLVSYSARVRTRTWELTAPVRLLDRFGFALSGAGSLGRMRLSYDPSHIEIPVLDSEPLRVDFDPIETWTYSVGATVARTVSGPIDVGLSARHRWFDLETAHRAGDAIVHRSERFGQWEAQLRAGWIVAL